VVRRILLAASLAALAACSKPSNPYTSTGGAGTGGCAPPPASYDCPAGSGDLACGIPASGADLRSSGGEVVLEAAEGAGTTRVLRVTAAGVAPLFTLAAREYLGVIDEGWAYISRPEVGDVVRRKLNAPDAPETFLTCIRDFDATFFADATALYLNSTIGLVRIDKAAAPTARLARLYPWGYQLTWFDGQRFYGTPISTTNGAAGIGAAAGGPIVVAESTGASCTCDCSAGGVGDLASCKIDPGGTCRRTPAALATEGLTYPVVRGADDSSIFVLTMSPYFGTLPSLVRVSKDGSKQTPLLGPGSLHETWAPGDAIAVGGGFVYARVASPDAYRSLRMNTDGTGATVLATSKEDKAGRALAIQAGADGVYFLLTDGTCTARLVRYDKPADPTDGGVDAAEAASDAAE
jgi:hypothetical protein